VDPNPTATALERCARALSPAGYGGLYHRGSAYFVGFTSDVDLNLSRLHAAFPDVEVHAFLARHSWDELRRISHAITRLMTASSAAGNILSVGPDEVRNVVEVEVRHPGSVLAKSLRTRYGSAIVLVPGDPIELLSTATPSIGSPSGLLGRPVSGSFRAAARPPSPAPGRTTYQDPMLAGMQIRARGNAACTAGFMYRGSLNPVDTSEGGVITAGHCFGGQVATTEWSQGGKKLGPFTRQRLVPRTRADAGTITTEFTKGVGFRNISNQVYVAPGAGTIAITTRAALNQGARGDIALRSGAYSGFDDGTLGTGGEGRPYFVDEAPFTRYVIFNVYKATFSKAIKLGDSGSPVFRGDGVALGILFARKARNHRVGFYSQIRNVENELRVPVYTGG